MPFKVLRGMASLEAISDRLDVEDADTVDWRRSAPKGIEVSVPARGSVRPIIHDMLKHLCSSISYGGAASLRELREMFRADPERYLIKLSGAAQPRVVRAVGLRSLVQEAAMKPEGPPGRQRCILPEEVPYRRDEPS